MQKHSRRYIDGTVDITTGTAMSADGVWKFRFPKLAYVAEKTGQFVVSTFNGAARLRPTMCMDEDGQSHSVEAFRSTPQLQRRIGAVVLVIGLPAATLFTAEPVVIMGASATEAGSTFVAKTIIDGWEGLETFKSTYVSP